MPKRVVFTADAYKEPYGQKIYERVKQLNLNIEIAKNNRITGLRGKTERETYRIDKNTLAVVNAPPSAFNLRPIPPSADWQYEQGGGGYPVGIVLAPIIPIPQWQMHYTRLLDDVYKSLNLDCDLTFELITHRFTPGSRDILMEWYPNTSLDFSETNRAIKRNKFGGHKFVYTKEMMKNMKDFFERKIALQFPKARILYWT